jgi:O-antigen ligase
LKRISGINLWRHLRHDAHDVPADQGRKYLLGFSITFTAMAISLSRGALAGSLLALALVAYRNRSHFDRAKVGRLALAMLGITIVVAPAIYGIWSERFSTVEISDLSSDDTTRDRLVTIALAGEGIAEHPLAGNGTSSYQLQYTDEAFGEPDQPGWIPNTETRILYDSGVVGFGLFIAFCCYLGASVTLKTSVLTGSAGAGFCCVLCFVPPPRAPCSRLPGCILD